MSLRGALDGAQGPLVDVVGIHGTQHTVTASVEDREHMAHQVLLGRDILQHYHVDVTRRPGHTREFEDDEE